MTNEILDKKDFDTAGFISDTFRNLTEGIAGLAASDRKDIYLSIGYILQKVRSGSFLKQIGNEWNRLREKGRIKPDYMNSTQHQECLQEMLDFLDNDSPDDIRFTFLKKIFLSAATENKTDRDSLLPQQYMRICRTLTAGEIIVLKTTFEMAKIDGWNPSDPIAQNWLNKITNKSNLKFPELVEIHEKILIEKNLLTPRKETDKSGVVLGEYYRLTNLGYGICEFIESYED